MIEIRPVVHVLGWLSILVGLFMAIPAAVDLAAGSPDWIPFAESACFAAGLGLILSLATWTRGSALKLDLRQAFLATILGWILVAGLGALPMLSLGVGFTDALFEAMSGITTTGSTVLTGLDGLPPGLLLWRALLQWIGGIGIIAVAVLILPLLRVGGMQIFKIESSDTSSEKVAGVLATLSLLLAVYASLTAICTGLYAIFGMSLFDALTHAFSTVSTGGFSTHDASFGHFQSPILHWTGIVFMIAGALPFVLYLRTIRRDRRALLRDSQVRAFLAFMAAVIGVAAVAHSVINDLPFGTALTDAAFNIVSVVTTTGFASQDYTTWGAGAAGLFLILTFVGGCTGSTSGAIKIFRYQILWRVVRNHVKRLFSPNRVVRPTYQGRVVDDALVLSVMAFLAVFIATIAATFLVLALLGLDTLTAFTAAATAVTNVGPGLGPTIGPAGNFAPLPDAAKLALTGAMLAGRLEILALLVIFDRDFWVR